MLRFLRIDRLAIIDTVELEFGPGLSVLTGETGAGKSIVVGAVELLLGGRASADLVRSGEEVAQIQAILERHDGSDLVVRRDVLASGRSRAFVDGTLVTSAELRQLTAPLVDLHGQHDHQTLLDPDHHLDILDAYAGLQNLRAEVASAFDAWQAARQAVDASQLDERGRHERREAIEFQLADIDSVAPRAGEDESLSDERHRLANADRIHRLGHDAYERLYEGDGAVLPQLSRVWKQVAELAALDTRLAPHVGAKDAVLVPLRDLADALRDCAADADAAPDQLQRVEDRLAALDHIKRRYGPALVDVLDRRERMAKEYEALSATADQRAALQAELDRRATAFLDVASTLSRARRAGAGRLAAALGDELSALAMPSARCEMRFEPETAASASWQRRGIDVAQFVLAANVGEEPRHLARIASGGELSRVMLALKSLATVDQPGKRLIFDEVDAGIGGRAADAVGARLRRLGEQFQVLCITHLAQVAAHAHAHFHVAKAVTGGRTSTRVTRQVGKGRVAELARMMGGDTSSTAVQHAARDLLRERAGSAAASERDRADPLPPRGLGTRVPR
ncbi:MAG: DNA repair protein RecN [Vicinamibacterales bacterium]